MSYLVGDIRQIGIVARNADDVMRFWASSMGVGPFYVAPEVEFRNYRYYGEEGPSPVIKCGVAHSGGLQIEVIEQLNDAPSAFLDIIRAGREGMHHLSSWFRDAQAYDATYSKLVKAGFCAAQEGTMASEDLRYAYFAADRTLPNGPFLEISEALKVPLFAAMFDELAQLNHSWDGRDPIRSMG